MCKYLCYNHLCTEIKQPVLRRIFSAESGKNKEEVF